MANWTAEELFAEIDRQAPNFGIPPKVAKALLLAENTSDGRLKEGARFSSSAASSAGARGVFQTLASTDAAILGPSYNFHPEDMPGQVRAGLAAMQEMRGRQKNQADVLELATMYNGGSAAWRAYRSGETEKVPAETKQYWQKVKNALGLEPQQERNMGEPVVATQPQGGTPQSAPQQAGSSSRSSQTSVTYDPALWGSMVNFANDITQQGGSADTAIAGLNAAAMQRKAAETAQQQAITQFATNIGTAVTAEAAVSAAAAARRQNILSAANLNIEDVESDIRKGFDTIDKTASAMEPLGKEIDARQAVGIFDNPLEWLVNQVRLPGMVGQYNSLAREQNRSIETVKIKQGMVATQQGISAAMDADKVMAAGVAKASAEASAAQERLAKAHQEGAGAAARDAATTAAIARSKFEVSRELATMTKEHIMVAEGLSERDAAKRSEELEIKKVNDWLTMVGSPQTLTPAQFKSMGKDKQKLLEAAVSGKIGPTFSEAAEMLDRFGSIQGITAGGDAAAMNWFKGTIAAAKDAAKAQLDQSYKQAKLGGKQVTKKTEQESVDNALDGIQHQYEGEARDMRTASENNPYRLAYPQIAKTPELANNPLAIYINTYGPLGKEPLLPKIDEKILLDRFTAAVTNGSMSAGDAAKAITQFYQVGVKEQARRAKYVLFGLDAATDYSVKIASPGFFGSLSSNSQVGSGDKPVNLMNPASVESYLTRNVAYKLTTEQQLTGVPL